MRWAAAGALLLGWLVHPIVGVVAFAAAYGVACWWYPLTNCWCCRGAGKHRSAGGKTFRRCGVCGGRGSWFRVGRRVANWLGGADL